MHSWSYLQLSYLLVLSWPYRALISNLTVQIFHYCLWFPFFICLVAHTKLCLVCCSPRAVVVRSDNFTSSPSTNQTETGLTCFPAEWGMFCFVCFVLLNLRDFPGRTWEVLIEGISAMGLWFVIVNLIKTSDVQEVRLWYVVLDSWIYMRRRKNHRWWWVPF